MLSHKVFSPLIASPLRQSVNTKLGRSCPDIWYRSFSSAKEQVDIKIVEVGPRDGLQNESQTVSTHDKINFIKLLASAGCQFIEAASFVSPKWVPTMADASDVVDGLQPWRSTLRGGANNPVISCVVPNIIGFERARQARVDEIAIIGSASEAFSQRNINCSVEESIIKFREVATSAEQHGILVRGYVSCALGCPYQGHVPPAEVARVTEHMLELGCHEVSLGDTIGIGTVGDTVSMLNAAKAVAGTKVLAVHFHDTYGQALVNILAAVQQGISTIDSSVGGLGGCPYADGASGNVATEDVIYMLHGMGLETGIDLDRLIDAGSYIHNILDRKTRSKVATATQTSRAKTV